MIGKQRKNKKKMIKQTEQNKEVTFTNEGLIENTNKEIITIGIPQTVIDDVYSISIGKTMLFKSKLLFLVWLINRGDKLIGEKDFNNKFYQLHINSHRKLFGSDDLEKMKKMLLDSNIIQHVGNASAEAKKCHTYKVTKSWKFKGKDTVLFHFPISYSFARNFQLMNYWVLPMNEQKKLEFEMKFQPKVINNKVTPNADLLEILKKMEALESKVASLEAENYELKNNKSQTLEAKVETIKQEINIYQQFAMDRMKEGVNDFENLYAELYNKFITDGMPEEIENELNHILYEAVESVLGK